MKIAVCLHGKIGGLGGKDGAGGGEEIVLPMGYSHFLKRVIHPNKNHDVDFFIHCWDRNYKKDLEILYSPKGIEVEKQIKFKIPESIKGDTKEQPTRKNSHYSRWYSYKKSVLLKKAQEKKMGFIYDGVLSTRFDMAWKWDLVFDEMDPKKFWMSQMYFYEVDGKKYYPHELRSLSEDKQKRVKKIKIGYPHTKGVWDAWFYTNSENTNLVSDLFDNMDELLTVDLKSTKISHHKILEAYLRKTKLIGLTDFYKDYIGCSVVRWEYDIFHKLHEYSYTTRPL